MRELSARETWFRCMVGRRLWRNNYCSCEVCKDVYENGIVISDENHADYCYDNECDYTGSGYPLKYFETKEERDHYEQSLPVIKDSSKKPFRRGT